MPKPNPTPRAARKIKDTLDALNVPEAYREVRSLPTGRSGAAGRPSGYSLDIAAELCRRIAEGELSIKVCREDGMPSLSAVFDWRCAHPEFAEMYSRAREQQGHACAELAVEYTREATPETAASARTKFEGDRWFAAKLLPKVYGDRVDSHVTGEIVHLTEEQRVARIAQLERKRLAREPATIEGTVEPER